MLEFLEMESSSAKRKYGSVRFVVKLLYPLLLPIALLFKYFYRVADLLFNLDKRAASSHLAKLTREIEQNYSFLFSEYGGRIIPELSGGDPSFDWAFVVLEIGDLRLRAVRDKGSTDWYITSKTRDSSWQQLDTLCRKLASKPEQNNPTFWIFRNHLSEIEAILADESGDMKQPTTKP
jgi:hypothetical protein